MGCIDEGQGPKLVMKLLAVGASRSSVNTSCMWTRTTNCIRKVLGASKGFLGAHKED